MAQSKKNAAKPAASENKASGEAVENKASEEAVENKVKNNGVPKMPNPPAPPELPEKAPEKYPLRLKNGKFKTSDGSIYSDYSKAVSREEILVKNLK